MNSQKWSLGIMVTILVWMIATEIFLCEHNGNGKTMKDLLSFLSHGEKEDAMASTNSSSHTFYAGRRRL